MQPSHPVEVTRYVERPIAQELTQPLARCVLPPDATWADVWGWAVCSDNKLILANCRMDRISGRRSPECDTLAPAAPGQEPHRG